MDQWQKAGAVRCSYVSSDIVFVRPHRTLPISVTGGWCALNCAHCGAHYLQGMVDIGQADASGMASCLISGGCNSQGRVPVSSHLARLAELHNGRTLNWHVGLIEQQEMVSLAPFVDVISFDFVTEDETIREVYGLDLTGDDYLRTYSMLRRYAPVIPHLTLGLRGGEFHGEAQALQVLKAVGLEALVLLVFIPTARTRYATCEPPPLNEVAQFVRRARCELPDTPIYLGCMRPGGKYRRRLDGVAVQAGVNKIVNPAPSAVRAAEELGLRIRWEDECCVIHRP